MTETQTVSPAVAVLEKWRANYLAALERTSVAKVQFVNHMLTGGSENDRVDAWHELSTTAKIGKRWPDAFTWATNGTTEDIVAVIDETIARLKKQVE